MGHQESLLFCDSKSDMLRLCKLLNRAASDSSERGLEYAGLDIFEVARLKQTVKTRLLGKENGPIFPAGCYAVWWGGERAPQTMDEFLLSHFTGKFPYWNTVFVEYTVPSPIELLAGIEEGHVNSVQENDWLRTFHPGADNQILLDLIDQL